MNYIKLIVVSVFLWVGFSLYTANAGMFRPPTDVKVRMSDGCECADFAKISNNTENNVIAYIRRAVWTPIPGSMAASPLLVACYPDGEWQDDAQAKCIEKE